jgi:hypothetical protein
VRYEPLAGQTIKPVPEREKPRVDKQFAPYSQALRNLQTAVSRLKRATTIEKRWRAKVRYYERALSATGKLHDEVSR